MASPSFLLLRMLYLHTYTITLDKFYIAYLCLPDGCAAVVWTKERVLHPNICRHGPHCVDITPTNYHAHCTTLCRCHTHTSQDTARTVFLSSSEAWSKVVQSKSVAQVFFHAQLGRQQSVTVTMSCSPECCVVYALDLETNLREVWSFTISEKVGCNIDSYCPSHMTFVLATISRPVTMG